MVSASESPHARVQRIVDEVLAGLERPIVVRGYAYVRWPCCEGPKHALAWAVAEAHVARTIWATLAERGAIPAGDAAPERRFACPVCFRGWWHEQRHGRRSRRRSSHGDPAGATCPLCQDAGTLDAPPSCVACVTMAVDPDGVSAAEARVAEITRALAPWGASVAERVIWRVRAPTHDAAPAALRVAVAAAAIATRRPGRSLEAHDTAATRRAAWRRAVDEDARVLPRTGRGVQPTGASFASLPDPFPLLDVLAARGDALVDLLRADAVVWTRPIALDGPAFGERVVLEDLRGARPGARPR